jgi:PAS domain S-box-containing protein
LSGSLGNSNMSPPAVIHATVRSLREIYPATLPIFMSSVTISPSNPNSPRVSRSSSQAVKAMWPIMMLQTWYREMETHYPQNDENNSFILSIIDNSPIAYLLVNNQFDIVYSNKMALSLFGYDDLKGVPINNLIPTYTRKAHSKKMAAYQKKPEFRKMGGGRELKGVRQDGTEVEVEIGLNPVTIIPERYILASIIDITERKKIEKFKDHFLMMMTHELRTPLNAILG